MSKSNKQLEAESRVRIADLHQEIKSTLAENPELAVLDELLSQEQDETGKYKVGLSQEQYDSLHSQISEGGVELGHELKRYVMRNHLEESNKRPLAVAQNEVIEVGQRLSALKSEESPNSKKIKKLEKEIFYKALEFGSFPVETQFERSQAESNMKQDLRHVIQEKHGIRVSSISFSMPSDAIIRAGRFPNL